MKYMKTSESIIFYAPFGRNIPAECIGGAEMGCLKTLEIYRNAGINVIQVDKPAKSEGKIKYAIKMTLMPLILSFILCKHRRAALHIVGFYNKIARYEYLLIKIGKLFRHKVIYELRNGSMITSYEDGTKSYRIVLEKLLTVPDIVLCQGLEYVNFIRDKYGLERSYYPNYIMDEYIKAPNLERTRDCIRLIYFGRVTKSKNVDISIRALDCLFKAGINAQLDIVGKCDDDYQQELNKIITESHLEERVHMHGRKDFATIANMLYQAHYFIFPSQERQEGHSNSLTEAMGCGVVPIVSRAGFNASICGDENLVIDDITAENFAKKILEIEKNGLWRKYSEQVYNRIINNYTQSRVAETLIRTVLSIFK